MENNQPVVKGIPEGEVIIFFAKINIWQGYCVIFGKPEDCLPEKGENMRELFDAKVAFFKDGVAMEIHPVKHGHKYATGGGFVETRWTGDISFSKPETDVTSLYNGLPISEVYIAL